MKPDVVISGIGQSAVGRRLGRTGLSLTLEAVLEAMADAGLTRGDIDGVATFPGAMTGAMEAFSPLGAADLVQALRLNCNWVASSGDGPGQLVAAFNAYNAIKAGLCRHVIVFRTLMESSAPAMRDYSTGARREHSGGAFAYLVPFDSLTPINWFAMWAQRHFHLYGTTREQLGWAPVNSRRNAALNPKAIFRKPFTIEEYLNEPLISSPFCMLDCDPLTDASTVFIMSSAEAAADLKSKPIRVEAIGSSMHGAGWWDQSDMPRMAAHNSAEAMWKRTDLKPKDVDVALLYDGFSFFVLNWLEAFGFCGLGEAGPFVEGGKRIAIDGELPVNPHGGQLSSGRTHGFGFVHEAVTQLRGVGGARQVPNDPRVAAVGVGGGPVCGSLLLVND